MLDAEETEEGCIPLYLCSMLYQELCNVQVTFLSSEHECRPSIVILMHVT